VDITKKTWIFTGTQAGCDGPVSTAAVESIRVELEQQSPAEIHFNQGKVSDYLSGGTCTAMSLEFLRSYFKIKKICRDKLDCRPKTILRDIARIGKKFAASSKKMRNRQAAYNTIEVMKLDDAIDFSRSKIQALVNYHFFTVDYTSQELDVDNIYALSNEVNCLPKGIFLIRILKHADNEKLEDYGHSLAYIKEDNLSLLYDPNYGARNLSASEHAKVLFEFFQQSFHAFQVKKARFYRLEPTRSFVQP